MYVGFNYVLCIPRNAMTYTGKHPSKNVTRPGSVLSTSERPRKKAKILLDDDSDDGTSESGGISVEEEGKPSGDHILGVNQEYAQRFEHNKKREELQRRVYNVPHRHRSLG